MIDFCNLQWTTAMEGGRIIHEKMPWMWYDSNAVFVDGNKSEPECALLHAYKNPKTVSYGGKTYRPTVACGVMRSVDTFGYGRFSAEIQLPKGENLWSCFWLVGSGENWPKGGEIDIVESWTNQFGGYYKCGIPQPPYLVPSWNTTTNVHWEEDYQHRSVGSHRLPIVLSLKRPDNNFVKYEVEWRPNTITFFVNGHRVRTYGYDVAQHLADKKMRVIFDLWTTGKNFACDTPMKIRNFEYKPIEVL